MKSKGRAEKRRGRQYRKSKTKRRNKILDLDPENVEGKKRAKELEKEMELKKKLNEPPKRNQSDFIPKSVREIMRFQEQLKKKDNQQNDASNDNHKKKNMKSSKEVTGKGLAQSSKTKKQLQSNQKKKENAHENNAANGTKANDIIKTESAEVPKIIVDIKKQSMTNRKLKNKLWSKMKKEKLKLKKIRKELNQINALERSKLKKRKREDSKSLVLDEEEEILDEDDLLNINLEDDDFEDVSRGVLRQDHVEFGEQAKEPPKKLKKLRDQMDARYEARRKFKEMQQTTTPKEIQQEMNKVRQMEITREKVLKNYEEARKRRMEKSTSATDSQIQQLQNFSAKFGARHNEQALLEF